MNKPRMRFVRFYLQWRCTRGRCDRSGWGFTQEEAYAEWCRANNIKPI